MNEVDLKLLYQKPFFELIELARATHKQNWKKNEIQLCTLLSIKTGGCSEDCSYCTQSARYNTDLETERLMDKETVFAQAKQAKENGSTRFCMGAAWRGVKINTKRFDQVIDIVKGVAEYGMEVCVTLGELEQAEADALKEAGVTAYNHNLDTSPEHYPKVVTTHTFEDRLKTIHHIQKAGMSVCCGGILGLGEATDDRIKMLSIISEFNPPPESIPINVLMPMTGTPFEKNEPVNPFELVRIIAITRIAVPKAKVRLSAGRTHLNEGIQSLCFFAGANSIFYGEKLLTADNPSVKKDLDLIKKLDLNAQAPNQQISAPEINKLKPCMPSPNCLNENSLT